jgi:peptide/nickel transport system substrate-binding protein
VAVGFRGVDVFQSFLEEFSMINASFSRLASMSLKSVQCAALATGLLALWPVAALAQQTLIVAAPQTPTGFDGDIPKVATRQMIVQANESLVRYKHVKGADGRTSLDPSEFEPNLAESWTVSPDEKTYVFKLRRGVKSAWGNEMTADDILWSFERAWQFKHTSFFLYNLIGLQSFKKTGDYEITLELKNPSKILLPMLTMYFPVLHDKKEVLKHATTDDPWGLKYIDQNLVGFGAYTVDSIKPGEQVVLKANPNYFRGKPFYDRVIYREVPSLANRVALLKTGQVQWVEDLPLKQVVDLKKDRSIKVESVVGTQPATLRMNLSIKPYDDKRIREAIVLATDYDAMNSAVFEGLGTPVTSIIPPIVPGHVDAFVRPKRDIARAKQLLAEAGYPKGIDLELVYAGTYWWMEPVSIQFKSQLADAGIRVDARRIPDPEFINRGLVPLRNMPLFPAGDATFVLDPVFTALIFGFSQGTANRNSYSNPEFNKLVTDALVETDNGKRLDMMKRAQQIHAQDNNWIMLFYPGVHQAMNRCVNGWIWNPDDWPRFADLRCDK